jgi:hypothetical protein
MSFGPILAPRSFFSLAVIFGFTFFFVAGALEAAAGVSCTSDKANVWSAVIVGSPVLGTAVRGGDGGAGIRRAASSAASAACSN